MGAYCCLKLAACSMRFLMARDANSSLRKVLSYSFCNSCVSVKYSRCSCRKCSVNKPQRHKKERKKRKAYEIDFLDNIVLLLLSNHLKAHEWSQKPQLTINKGQGEWNGKRWNLTKSCVVSCLVSPPYPPEGAGEAMVDVEPDDAAPVGAVGLVSFCSSAVWGGENEAISFGARSDLLPASP
jgi:hypothetical protein